MVFQEHSGIDVEKSVTDTQFKIATNSKLFSILSDSIYTRKIDAVIRELCCNAFDAHVEARQDRKFQITLPSEFNSEFRVRDFGLGLCEEDMQMYTTYGESTKSKSNAYIGAFGIGAKSPFAYTNTFNVTSYNDGMARAYSMFVENGVPKMTKLGEGPSDEPSGLEVFFPVAVKDIDEFKDKALEICALMADKIEFLQVSDRWMSNFNFEVKKYCWEDADYLGQGYKTCGLTVDFSSNDYLYIVQGNVKYEMDLNEVSTMLKFSLGNEYTKMFKQINNDFYIAGFLRVPNGTFVPHPSRERLTFDDLTKESIKYIFEKIYKYYITDAVNRILDGVRSYYDLHCRIRNVSKIVSQSPRILNFSIDDHNNTIWPYTIANYDDWRHFDFSCIQIIGHRNNIYHFKRIPKMHMRGEEINRIYYVDKYPLSSDYRYRVLKDKIQSEAESAFIFPGSINNIFTENDKSTFINIRTLPKLTQEDLIAFKKTIGLSTTSGVRVTKEDVSFIFTRKDSEKRVYGNFYQESVSNVMNKISEYPIYWVGSNRRYVFSLGGRDFRLKIQRDLLDLRWEYLNFFIDSIAKNSPSNKNKEPIKLGVVVLPEGHTLRKSLPELEPALQDSLRSAVTDFMNTTFFDINIPYSDCFFEKLIMDQELTLKLAAGKQNNEYKNLLEKWFSAGMPNSVNTGGIRRKFPFTILGQEGIALQDDYNSRRNVWRLDVREMYSYLAYHGFPLFKLFEYTGIHDNDVAEDLLDYIRIKCEPFDNERN
jgi:hypothetical protein